MRVSVDSTDPGYVSNGHLYRVFFCGSERSNVVTADEEARMVVVFALDEQGRPRLDRERQDIARETLYGDVRIEVIE